MKITTTRPLVVLSLVAATSLQAADNGWTGTTSSDWSDVSNWSAGNVPNTGDNAKVNISTGNIATITSVVPNVNDLDIGQVGGPQGPVGANGRLDLRAGSVSVNGWSFVGRNGGTGVFNIADTASTGGTYTGHATGSGNFTSARLYVGLDGNASKGTVNINTSGTVSLSSDLNVGFGGTTGKVNFDGGTINRTGGWTVIGEGGQGEFRMSAGTMTGSGDTFVGLNGGTGIFTKSGGDVTAGNYLGFGRSGGTGTGNFTGSGTTSATRIYVGGVRDEGGTGVGVGTMNIDTTGTISSTSDFSVGTNSGKGTVNMTAGTLNANLNANSWMIIGETQAGKGGSIGLFTQHGGTVNVSAVDTNARLWLGSNEGNSAGAASSGTYTLNGGVLNTRNTIVGKNGTGTINQNGGTANILQGTDVNATDHRLGEAAGATGNYNLTNGILNVVGNFQIGASGTGNFVQSGGTASFTNYPVVGRFVGGIGTVSVSAGSFTQTDAGTSLIIGEEGTGTLNVSDTGSVVANGNIRVGFLGTGNGTVNLNGGTITAPFISKGAGTAQLNFNGGTFVAPSAQTEIFQNFDASNTQILSGGLTIQTNVSVGTGVGFDGVGSLTKQGTGNLTLNGVTTHTGGTYVANGTLTLGATGGIGGPGVIDVAQGATLDASSAGFSLLAGQTLTGKGSVNGAFTVTTGTVAPGNSIGTLSFTNSVVLGGASTSNFEIEKIGLSLNSDLLTTTGSLTLGGILNVSSLGGAFTFGDTWNLFDATSGISGSFGTLNLPAVSGSDYWDTSLLNTNGTITFVPEPSSVLLGLSALGLLARRRRSRI